MIIFVKDKLYLSKQYAIQTFLKNGITGMMSRPCV